MTETEIDWPEVEGAQFTRDDEEVAKEYRRVAEEQNMDIQDLVDDIMFMLDQRGDGAVTPGADSFTAGDEDADWRLEALRIWETIKGAT